MSTMNLSKKDRRFCKAVAIVRTVYQIPVESIDGLTSFEIQDIESGKLYPTTTALTSYANSIGLDLEQFLDKINDTHDFLETLEEIS